MAAKRSWQEGGNGDDDEDDDEDDVKRSWLKDGNEDDDEGVDKDGGEGDDEDHCLGEKGNDLWFQVNIEPPLLGHQESRPSAVFRGRSPVE